MTKIAILIADSNEPFFQNLKYEIYESAWSEFRENGIDVFYIIGKGNKRWLQKIDQKIEEMRYSKIWPFQYLIDNLTLFKYRFSKPEVQFKNDLIEVDIPEGLKYLTVKILAGLDALSRKKYDFVFRTTLSTVLNYNYFTKIVSEFASKEKIYAGYLIDFNENKFISGASSLLSRGTIEILIKNRNKLNFGRLDDVAFGRILESKIDPISLPHANFSTPEEVQNLSIDELYDCMSYRCKSSFTPRNDDIIAKTLLKRFSKKQN